MFQDKISISKAEIIVNEVTVDAIDLVTDKGVQTAASMLGSPYNSQAWMPFIAIGAGLVAPSSVDESLESELYRKEGTVTVIANTYFVEATFGIDEPIGGCTFREVGIFNALSGGDMGARWLLVADVEKSEEDYIVIRCAITLT